MMTCAGMCLAMRRWVFLLVAKPRLDLVGEVGMAGFPVLNSSLVRMRGPSRAGPVCAPVVYRQKIIWGPVGDQRA
jgi:hypothetical protein